MRAKKTSSIKKVDAFWGYTFIIIPFVGLILFSIIPLIMTIYASLTAWPLGQSFFDAKFIGLKNYKELFHADLFWKSLGNTFFYMIGIPIGLFLSLIFANLMNRGTGYENTFRVIFYVPVVTSIVAVSFVFQRLFMSDGGVINTFLQNIGVTNPPNWLGHPQYTKWVIIIMSVWKGLGSSIILYIAGMQGISNSYYEAATIDGATGLKMFRYITLPLLKPVTFYLIVTSVIGGAQMYVEPRLIFAANGPANSTFTTVIYLYDYTFSNSRAGYGSAIAVVLGVIVFGLTALQLYVNRRTSK